MAPGRAAGTGQVVGRLERRGGRGQLCVVGCIFASGMSVLRDWPFRSPHGPGLYATTVERLWNGRPQRRKCCGAAFDWRRHHMHAARHRESVSADFTVATLGEAGFRSRREGLANSRYGEIRNLHSFNIDPSAGWRGLYCNREYDATFCVDGSEMQIAIAL